MAVCKFIVESSNSIHPDHLINLSSLIHMFKAVGFISRQVKKKKHCKLTLDTRQYAQVQTWECIVAYIRRHFYLLQRSNRSLVTPPNLRLRRPHRDETDLTITCFWKKYSLKRFSICAQIS